MVPSFIFAVGSLRDQARGAIVSFKDNLPFEYEEHRNDVRAQAFLTARALEYAELADTKNYKAHRSKTASDQIAVFYVSPSAANPENIAKAEEASRHLALASLWIWASRTFDEKKVSNTHSIDDAISLAREADAADLFEQSSNENADDHFGMRRGAVAGTAAVVLNFRQGRTPHDLAWARDVVARAIHLPEKRSPLWSPRLVIPWHPAIYVARGLAADLREGTAEQSTAHDLLRLIAHPLQIVALVALEETCGLWFKNRRLTWAALVLSLSLCRVPPRSRDDLGQQDESLHSLSEASAAVDAAFAFYTSGKGWVSLPLPPPAWVKVDAGKRRRRPTNAGYADDVADTRDVWVEPDTFWHSKRAAETLKRIPFAAIMTSDAKGALLDFFGDALDWTNQKNAPPWAKPGRRDRPTVHLIEWTSALGNALGVVAGLLRLSEFQPRFLAPILALDGDSCWALLSALASTYVCAYVYDAPIVPADAVETLDLCLGRFLQSPAFRRHAHRSGELSGFHQPEFVRTLMFISVERADLAARYVNGDWSEISRILPLVDRFIRAAGWAHSVMAPFLTLCERAKVNYPADGFADQVLSVLADGPVGLKGWHGTFTSARIAELVQYFAHRDAPMKLDLAQKFLRILDMLVDMGDRRSAALQLCESFREVRLPSTRDAS